MHALSKVTAVVTLALSLVASSQVALAADVRMIARVTAIQVAVDGKSAVATLINSRGGGEVTVTVTDRKTLDMFTEQSIRPGDTVRTSYDDAGGVNLSKTFKKAEGC